jgi:DNA-binding transcriptional regulator YiaG
VLYSVPATGKTPALIIYLLDVNASMSQDCGGKPRIEVVTDALQKAAVKMVQRSTKGTVVSPRYRVAMFAYGSQVIDLLGGMKTIDELAKMGVPKLTTLDGRNTAAAFAEAEKLLEAELPNLQDCPAPLVCHMTDGEYTGANPAPIAKRIMEMSVPDGNVLVENIYLRPGGVAILDVDAWPGVISESELPDQYSRTLFRMSSPIPESYLSVLREFGYRLAPDTHMFFPGDQPEFVELAFTMSGTSRSADFGTSFEEKMPGPYSVLASHKAPALIIYLLDVSASMSQDCGGKPRIEVVTDALQKVAVKMVQRSTKGTVVSPRYRVAMFAYSSQVIDLLGGVKTIDELVKMGVPRLTTLDMTDTASAFVEAEKLLRTELPNLQDCPAPLVCHITDGDFQGNDPLPVAKRIMGMSVPDGNVLVANIYLKAREGRTSFVNGWPGFTYESEHFDQYAQILFQMSSPVPNSFRNDLDAIGYQLCSGARMFYMGETINLPRLGLVRPDLPLGDIPWRGEDTVRSYWGMLKPSEVGISEIESLRLYPQPDDLLHLGKENMDYRFAPHPAVPTMAFGQEGRKSTVYQLKRIPEDQPYALKVFKPAYRGSYLVEVAQSIARYADLPGMEVCQRMVLTRDGYGSLIKQYPDFAYAVLMPWVAGRTWYDMVVQAQPISHDQGLALAWSAVDVLSELEAEGLAHCDVAGSNVLIDLARLRVHLVDVEDIYVPRLTPPTGFPAGTDGYQHQAGRTNPKGQWCAEGDRFAGALLLAEILGWPDPRIRQRAYGEHYFANDELQDATSERYLLMLEVLSNISRAIAELFQRAWASPTLKYCPTLNEWANVIVGEVKAIPTFRSDHAELDDALKQVDANAFGLRLKKLRQTMGKGQNQGRITQREVATHLNTSPVMYSSWESGRSLPDTAVLPDLADYFQVSIDFLLGYQPKSQPSRKLKRRQ